ncbi:NAD(P)/FAD-dependent oxidoreductase [Marinobacterium jannaschii]|uniref:NAD(P)/FAD-dependent oxidoreductase n=1 Tax=Marinobacterium jannaschii TaxID=64970 RepID=UPI00048083E2|nr:NAD(P)/FAD-dependent oxidoreductase [Marinobacterium jannaschii]
MQKIVIVGGGAGGLELASQLGRKLGKKKKAEIILVDQNPSHIWKPLLHEVATGSLDTSTDGVVYHAHAARHGYRFILGRFEQLDAQRKVIRLAPTFDDRNQPLLPERELNYDMLVLGIGSVSNDFGTPGVQDHCYFLDSHAQAERFHQSLLSQFVRIDQHSGGVLKIAIVGAGATGVELSAELHHVTDLLKRYGMPNMTPQQLKVTLIEAGPRILPALPVRISDSAWRELSRMGVEVRENTRISRATDTGFVTAEDQLIEADLMIWAAGVKAPDYVKELGVFELNRANQILAKPTLQSSVDEDIYVLGDCCGFQQEDGSWVPPRAQSAHQMASQIQANIIRRLKGQAQQPFSYKDHGSLVSLSRFSTVGSLMGNLTSKSMFVEGHLARLMYISLYRMHQIAIHGWGKAALIYVAETINKVVRPKMKLH